MEIEVEVSTSSASLSIWFLHWLKISQGSDDADRKEEGGEFRVSDAGDIGDTEESSVTRRWPEWWSIQGVEDVTDNGIVSDQKAAI